MAHNHGLGERTRTQMPPWPQSPSAAPPCLHRPLATAAPSGPGALSPCCTHASGSALCVPHAQGSGFGLLLFLRMGALSSSWQTGPKETRGVSDRTAGPRTSTQWQGGAASGDAVLTSGCAAREVHSQPCWWARRRSRCLSSVLLLSHRRALASLRGNDVFYFRTVGRERLHG